MMHLVLSHDAEARPRRTRPAVAVLALAAVPWAVVGLLLGTDPRAGGAPAAPLDVAGVLVAARTALRAHGEPSATWPLDLQVDPQGVVDDAVEVHGTALVDRRGTWAGPVPVRVVVPVDDTGRPHGTPTVRAPVPDPSTGPGPATAS